MAEIPAHASAELAALSRTLDAVDDVLCDVVARYQAAAAAIATACRDDVGDIAGETWDRAGETEAYLRMAVIRARLAEPAGPGDPHPGDIDKAGIPDRGYRHLWNGRADLRLGEAREAAVRLGLDPEELG